MVPLQPAKPTIITFFCAQFIELDVWETPFRKTDHIYMSTPLGLRPLGLGIYVRQIPRVHVV